MALFTSNLSKNIAWDQIAKGEDKTMAQKILEPVQIDERQYREIHEENMKNTTFCQHQEDVEQAKIRWERALRESTKALKEYDVWSTKLECLPLIIQARNDGRQPKGDDKEILEMGGETLEKKVEELRKADDAKNKDKERARAKFIEAEKAWKDFAMMMGQPRNNDRSNGRRNRNKERLDNYRRRPENDRRPERREENRWNRQRSDRDNRNHGGRTEYRGSYDRHNHHNEGYRRQYQQNFSQNRGYHGNNRGRGHFRQNNNSYDNNQRRGNAQPTSENKTQ
ncbi:unnamed protein product [Oikopleura dioica]|uniref:Uncharacterized protein n=1 Tax=Oikopleura dioica TaxID=34765 RepID=E4YTI4_OIKDI|nr:unnamed protein product [Oikopleura dioica]